MVSSTFLFAIAAGTAPTLALLASTTHYSQSGSLTACGCTPAAGTYAGTSNAATGTTYITAAGSQALFDTAGGTWCGNGCGRCYNATAMDAPYTETVAGQDVIILVNNLCPPTAQNPSCPAVGSKNAAGYEYHFDILDDGPLFGNNAIVEFEEIDCPAAITSVYSACECAASPGTGWTSLDDSSAVPAPSAAASNASAGSASAPATAAAASGTSAPASGAGEGGASAPAGAPASSAAAAAGGAAVPSAGGEAASASVVTYTYTASGHCGGARPSKRYEHYNA